MELFGDFSSFSSNPSRLGNLSWHLKLSPRPIFFFSRAVCRETRDETHSSSSSLRVSRISIRSLIWDSRDGLLGLMGADGFWTIADLPSSTGRLVCFGQLGVSWEVLPFSVCSLLTPSLIWIPSSLSGESLVSNSTLEALQVVGVSSTVSSVSGEKFSSQSRLDSVLILGSSSSAGDRDRSSESSRFDWSLRLTVGSFHLSYPGPGSREGGWEYWTLIKVGT